MIVKDAREVFVPNKQKQHGTGVSDIKMHKTAADGLQICVC